jgi:hypothetical protein
MCSPTACAVQIALLRLMSMIVRQTSSGVSDCLLDDVAAAVRIGEICREHLDLAGCPCRAPGQRVQPLLVDVGNDDPGTLPGQRQRSRGTDSTRAGDERRAAI